MYRTISIIVGSALVLGLLGSTVGASPAREVGPAAAVTGTWRSYTCGDCFSTLAVAPGGIVWGGTASGGVTRWDPASGKFQRFTDAAGLPGNWVNALAVDNRGRPWVALRQSHYPTIWGWLGISTYDGTRWITYDTSNGLPSNSVYGLAADAGGGVWAATNAGLAHFDGANWTVYDTSAGLPSNDVVKVAIGPDGTVWAATLAGLARFRQGVWSTFAQPGTPQQLLADPWGQVWATWWDDNSLSSGFARFDGTTWTPVDLGGTVDRLALGAGPRVWATVSSTPRTLQYFDGTAWTTLAIPDLASSGTTVVVAANASSPDVYLGRVVAGGISRFDGRGWTTARIQDGPGDLISEAIAVGPGDSLVVGQFGGTRRFEFTQISGGIWRSYQGDTPTKNLTFNMPVAIDRAGTIWLASYRDGVARYAAGSWQYFSSANGLPSDLVRAVATDLTGRLWVGTDDAGAALYDGATWRRYTAADGLASQNVRSALVDHSGRVWLGTSGAGLSRFDGARWRTFTVADGLGGSDVFDLAEGRDGTVWAAGHGWVARYDGAAAWQSFKAPAASTDSASFVAVTVAHDGAVWYAEISNTDGVARFDGSTWQTFTSADGLVSDNIYDLAVDSHGTIWAATLLGVAAFVPDVPTPTPPSPSGPCICQLARRALPGAVLDDAVANPERYDGWQQPLDPGKPVSPYNPARTCLSLRNPNVAYHSTFNGPVWRVGCP